MFWQIRRCTDPGLAHRSKHHLSKINRRYGIVEMWKCGNKKGHMKQQHKVRLSLDIPADQHIHLKMLATKRGISMREYILESLAIRESAEEKQPDVDLDNATFRMGLQKLRKERYQLAKKLSKR